MTITLNQMRKRLEANNPELHDTNLLLIKSLMDRVRNKPFWIWDKEEHKQADIDNNGDCCFNHVIGLPVKDYERPLYPWQKKIVDALDKSKYVYLLKAAGTGVSEITLRYMAYLCLRGDDTYKNAQMSVITGPRVELSIGLIARMKHLFEPTGIFFNTMKTIIDLNGCIIEAFPSHHLDAMRGLSNLKFIMADEAEFWPENQITDVMTIIERYIGKSNPKIVLISTPYKPGGLMESIHKDPHSIYNKIYLPYTVGLGTIFSQEDIAEAQQSASFQREYNLQFSGGLGSLLNVTDLDKCKQLGSLVGTSEQSRNNAEIMQQSLKAVGLDLG